MLGAAAVEGDAGGVSVAAAVGVAVAKLGGAAGVEGEVGVP